MTRAYDWPPRVAEAIAALPPHDPGLAGGDARFWSQVEATGDTAPALEVLAYLVREAYAHGQRAAAERVFAVLWERAHRQLIGFGVRALGGYLGGAVDAADLVVEAFRVLGVRLRAASGITFYEVTFLGGLKKLMLDQRRGLDSTVMETLSVSPDDGDEGEERDVHDAGATDPEQQALATDRQEELRRVIPERLAALPLVPRRLPTCSSSFRARRRLPSRLA